MEQERLIDNYSLDRLTEYEKDKLELLLKEGGDFENETNFIKNLITVTGIEDRTELRKTLTDLEFDIASEDTEVMFLFSIKTWLIIIPTAVIIILTILKLYNPFAPDTEDLYLANFSPYSNVVFQPLQEKNHKDKETVAFSFYENEYYKTAAYQFNTLYNKTQKSYLLLYQANSLMALGNTKDAIPLLEKHQELKDPLLVRGKWYLALAYLKEKREKESIAMLKEIIKDSLFKKGSAEKLLEQLD